MGGTGRGPGYTLSDSNPGLLVAKLIFFPPYFTGPFSIISEI